MATGVQQNGGSCESHPLNWCSDHKLDPADGNRINALRGGPAFWPAEIHVSKTSLPDSRRRPGPATTPTSPFDTNVVSELMRPSPDPTVEGWVAGRAAASMFFSAVGEAELRYGLEIMPTGRRRDALAADVEGMLREDFAGRVLPFDREAARAYARIAADRRAAGRPISHADCQIGAIARSRGMAVATRNTRDFENMGVELIDPWTGE